jgi:hypothetical protein
MSASICRAAKPRWLWAFFTSTGSSAKVLPKAGNEHDRVKAKAVAAAPHAGDLAR